MKIKSILQVFVLSALAAACGSEPQTSEEIMTEPAATEQAETTAVLDIILPTPSQMIGTFETANLGYTENLINSLENNVKYTSKNTKLMNLGVYSADLGYMVLGERFDKSKQYFKQILDLAKETGLSEVYDPSIYAGRFEKNIGKKDSILILIGEISESMDWFVAAYEQPELAVLSYAGAWIELNYLASKNINASNKSAILRKIMDQMNYNKMIIAAIKGLNNNNSEITSVVAEMEKLDEAFVKIPAIAEAGGKFRSKGADLNAIDATELFKQLEQTRKTLTQN
jgi:hypothetical protein